MQPAVLGASCRLPRKCQRKSRSRFRGKGPAREGAESRCKPRSMGRRGGAVGRAQSRAPGVNPAQALDLPGIHGQVPAPLGTLESSPVKWRQERLHSVTGRDYIRLRDIIPAHAKFAAIRCQTSSETLHIVSVLPVPIRQMLLLFLTLQLWQPKPLGCLHTRRPLPLSLGLLCPPPPHRKPCQLTAPGPGEYCSGLNGSGSRLLLE